MVWWKLCMPRFKLTFTLNARPCQTWRGVVKLLWDSSLHWIISQSLCLFSQNGVYWEGRGKGDKVYKDLERGQIVGDKVYKVLDKREEEGEGKGEGEGGEDDSRRPREIRSKTSYTLFPSV